MEYLTILKCRMLIFNPSKEVSRKEFYQRVIWRWLIDLFKSFWDWKPLSWKIHWFNSKMHLIFSQWILNYFLCRFVSTSKWNTFQIHRFFFQNDFEGFILCSWTQPRLPNPMVFLQVFYQNRTRGGGGYGFTKIFLYDFLIVEVWNF